MRCIPLKQSGVVWSNDLFDVVVSFSLRFGSVGYIDVMSLGLRSGGVGSGKLRFSSVG